MSGIFIGARIRQAFRLDQIEGRFDRTIFAAAAALAALGVVMVASSSIAVAEDHGVGPFHYLVRHVMFLAVGMGLDEDTAAFIAPDNTVHVEGSGAITVVDAAEVQFSSMDSVNEGRPVCLLGVKLHILTQGATFNLHTRLADAGSLVKPRV